MTIAHRYPLLLIDRVIECNPGVSAVAIKNVSLNEKVFVGHFPGKPIFPAIYIVEGLCQCAQVMLGAKVAVTAKLEDFKFLAPVIPGDQLRLEITIDAMIGDFQKATAKALVDGKIVAKGTIIGRSID